MTRRATVLDSLGRARSRSFRAAPGQARHQGRRVTTRRGTVSCSRQDDGVPDGVVFITFAYVEAAAIS
jgi:formate dehydrogenase major subunit